MQSTEFQEIEEGGGGGGGSDTGTVNRSNMLRLSNAFSTTANGGDHHGNGTLKRRSPSSSSLQEPTSKKRPLQPSSSAGDHHLHGFTKLPLPAISPIGSPPSPSTSIPFLGRCLSYPIYSPETNKLGILSNPQSPEINGSAIKALQPSLRRSVSDPTHPPPSSRDMGLNSIKVQSSGSKRLKRMEECIRDMNQWWNEILQEAEEEEEEEAGLEDYTNNTPPKEEESENKTEEAVSVEKTGECLIIKFNCPCTKCYQILLSGKNCYYKLM